MRGLLAWAIANPRKRCNRSRDGSREALRCMSWYGTGLLLPQSRHRTSAPGGGRPRCIMPSRRSSHGGIASRAIHSSGLLIARASQARAGPSGAGRSCSSPFTVPHSAIHGPKQGLDSRGSVSLPWKVDRAACRSGLHPSFANVLSSLAPPPAMVLAGRRGRRAVAAWCSAIVVVVWRPTAGDSDEAFHGLIIGG